MAVAYDYADVVIHIVGVHPEMVDFGSVQGRSDMEIDGVAVLATACIAPLRRRVQ
jgi:hypothetical protein